MPRGRYNENVEFVQTAALAVALWPMTSKKRWLCNTGHTMHLDPISKDLPPQEWRSDCRTISIEQRDQTLQQVLESRLDAEGRTATPTERKELINGIIYQQKNTDSSQH